MSKPHEWWILNRVTGSDMFLASDKRPTELGQLGDATRVIEYSAYLDMQVKLATVCQALNHVWDYAKPGTDLESIDVSKICSTALEKIK